MKASALIFLIPLLLVCQGGLVELFDEEFELKYFWTLGGDGVVVLGEGLGWVTGGCDEAVDTNSLLAPSSV